MVLYWITLVPFEEEFQAEDPGFIAPFYADDASFDGLVRQSAQILKLLLERGSDWGYFPELAKLLFMEDLPDQEDTEKRECESEGLHLNFV